MLSINFPFHVFIFNFFLRFFFFSFLHIFTKEKECLLLMLLFNEWNRWRSWNNLSFQFILPFSIHFVFPFSSIIFLLRVFSFSFFFMLSFRWMEKGNLFNSMLCNIFCGPSSFVLLKFSSLLFSKTFFISVVPLCECVWENLLFFLPVWNLKRKAFQCERIFSLAWMVRFGYVEISATALLCCQMTRLELQKMFSFWCSSWEW